MPVKTERLLPLLGTLLGCYFALKFLVNSLVMDDNHNPGVFTLSREKIGGVSVEKFTADIKFKTFLEELQQKSKISEEFFRKLQSSAFQSYFFETPSLSKESLETKDFEFVLVSAQALQNIQSDVSAFAEYFDCDQQGGTVTSFLNLGGDARLVVPCPQGSEGEHQHYSSLAPFMRAASEGQIQEFWRESARIMLEQVRNSNDKLWMSTSGTGVYWLHLR